MLMGLLGAAVFLALGITATILQLADGVSTILITLPIVLPLLGPLGIDPIHYGIIVVTRAAVEAALTPGPAPPSALPACIPLRWRSLRNAGRP